MGLGPHPAVESAAAELVARIRSGDALAEEELVLQYRRAVLAIAIARTHDREAARDISQEVLISVLGAIREGRIREPEKIAGFILGTTRNLINNSLRVRVRRAETALADAEPEAVDPVPALEASERRTLVRRELARYSPLDQQILLMSLVDGHSLVVIAERLNLSHEAVRARKSRLVKRIMEKFATVSQSGPPRPRH